MAPRERGAGPAFSLEAGIGEEEVSIGGGKNRERQARQPRADGWTKAKRRLFLDHLAATANVAMSAKAAEMTDGSAFALARRDEDFARDWRAALQVASLQVDGLLIERSVRKKPEPAEGEGGESVPLLAPDVSTLDPQLAMELMRYHQARIDGRPRGGGVKPKRASVQETDAALMKQLGALARRTARLPRCECADCRRCPNGGGMRA